jgi:two-component sensor histidine kinase
LPPKLVGLFRGREGDLKRLISIDLPRRLSPRVPRLATEVAAAAVITAAMVLVRASLRPVLGDAVPFSFTFLSVVLATLVAGWRSGLVALVVGEVLVWYFVLPIAGSFTFADPKMASWLIVVGLTQLLMVGAMGLYQSEVRRGQTERTRRINFLGHALREMDHRTRNNFQIVTSLLQLQSNRSASEEVKAALREASERLQAVSAVYAALAPSSQNLAAIRLQDQLEEMCGQIRRGILPEGIALTTELEPILVPHETAVAIGIIVNELVTNACKHAFPDGRGTIAVRTSKGPEGAVIEVADDGRGLAKGPEKKGLGTRLVAAFVQRVRGTSEVHSSEAGTVHIVTVPLRA